MHSRIRPTLPNGSIVTTPRTCVDYIVTEYGIAHIKSNPTWRRAELLIELAHPNFRDELIKEAEKMKIWEDLIRGRLGVCDGSQYRKYFWQSYTKALLFTFNI